MGIWVFFCFLMGTASAQTPYGITAHSYGNFGHKLDTSSSNFPNKVGFSRINLYQSSTSITNSKVCGKRKSCFLSFLNCYLGEEKPQMRIKFLTFSDKNGSVIFYYIQWLWFVDTVNFWWSRHMDSSSYVWSTHFSIKLLID